MVSSLVLVDTSSGGFDIPEYAELCARLNEIARTDGMEVAFEYNAQYHPLAQRRFERYPELCEISVPTLVMVGEEDVAFRQPSEVVAKGMPNTRLHIAPQATHTPQEETPEAFNELLIRFLAEVDVR